MIILRTAVTGDGQGDLEWGLCLWLHKEKKKKPQKNKRKKDGLQNEEM